jgi:hypothetical protein
MKIKEIFISEGFDQIAPLIKSTLLNSNQKNLDKNLENLLKENYKIFAALEKNQCLALVIAKADISLMGNKIFEIKEFFLSKKTSISLEDSLIKFCKKIAKKENCTQIIFSTETINLGMQKAFSRNSFIISGFVFKENL